MGSKTKMVILIWCMLLAMVLLVSSEDLKAGEVAREINGGDNARLIGGGGGSSFPGGRFFPSRGFDPRFCSPFFRCCFGDRFRGCFGCCPFF